MKPRIICFFLSLVCVLAISCHSIQVKNQLQVRYPNAEIEKKTNDNVVWYLVTLNSGTQQQTQGVCDMDGEQIIAPDQYSHVEFGKECYYVGDSINNGVFDLYGNEIIAPGRYAQVKYVETEPQHYLVIGDDGSEGILDLLGNEIVPCRFYKITYSGLDDITVQSSIYGDPYKYDPQESTYEDNELSYLSHDGSSNQLETHRPDVSIVEEYIESGNSGGAAGYLYEFVEDYGSDPEVEYQCAVLLVEVIKGYSVEMMKGLVEMNQPLVMSLQMCQNAVSNNQSTWLMSAAGKGHQQAAQMLQFKMGYTGGGYNSGYNSDNNSYSGKSKSGTCSLCNGKGWIAGSSTPTYGNMDSKWCSQCNKEVGASHSHDTCPSCGGSGNGS